MYLELFLIRGDVGVRMTHVLYRSGGSRCRVPTYIPMHSPPSSLSSPSPSHYQNFTLPSLPDRYILSDASWQLSGKSCNSYPCNNCFRPCFIAYKVAHGPQYILSIIYECYSNEISTKAFSVQLTYNCDVC